MRQSALFDGYFYPEIIEHFATGLASASGPFASGWVQRLSPSCEGLFPLPFPEHSERIAVIHVELFYQRCLYTFFCFLRDNQEKNTHVQLASVKAGDFCGLFPRICGLFVEPLISFLSSNAPFKCGEMIGFRNRICDPKTALQAASKATYLYNVL